MARHYRECAALDAQTNGQLQQLLQLHRADIDRLAALRSALSDGRSTSSDRAADRHEWPSVADATDPREDALPAFCPEDLRLPPIPARHRREQQRTHPQRDSGDLRDTAQPPETELPPPTVFHCADDLVAAAPDGSSGRSSFSSTGRLKAVAQTDEPSEGIVHGASDWRKCAI